MVCAAVIGLGRFGATLARELVTYGAEVIAIDTSEENVAEVRRFATVAVAADGTEDKGVARLAE